MKNILNKNKGSIALISMVIISVFTLILVVAISETSISTGYRYLDDSAEDYSYYSSEGCLEEALLRIEQDSDFTGAVIAYDDGSCTIAVTGTNPKIVDVTLVSGAYTQNFRGEAAISENGHAVNTSLSSWEEI